MTSIEIGEISVTTIIELNTPFSKPLEFFDEATDDALAPHRHWLVPRAIDPRTGMMVMPVQSYLVRTRHHTILLDTCVGCHKSYDGISGWDNRSDESWLINLQAAGVSPDEVDYVFCTHLHVDHCGWNTRLENGQWVPTFPNARYIVSGLEYDQSRKNNSSVYRENVLPVMEAGLMDTVDMDFALDDNIWISPSVGHTAGHICIHLSSNHRKATMSGDLMHSPIQLAHPDWSPNFDHDMERSAVTRRRFLEDHCDRDVLVLTAHFPLPSMGHIVSHADREFDFRYLGED